jgi:hypothetical protein
MFYCLTILGVVQLSLSSEAAAQSAIIIYIVDNVINSKDITYTARVIYE